MAETPTLKRIGRYDVERVLGEGAMGVVYEANDARLHRRVAVKTILKSALDSDSAREYSMRFKREAQAVARLNHPNIVQVFDFAEEGDVAYIVMELVRGRELKTFFEAKERFEVKEVVHIMGELCDALHFAHEANIIHRDIKPANVMIDTSGRVKLTDFGVARINDQSDRTVTEKTQAGAVVGTPAYMSPEQIGGQQIDRRTDIFSAGVILYEFLVGEKPFQGSGVWTIAKKILHDEPAAPSTRNQKVSPLFDVVVSKALAKSPEARYQTARDLGQALKRALEGLPQVEDVEKTVKLRIDPEMLKQIEDVGDPTVLRTVPVPPPQRTEAVELEFWRSIKDGSDPNDFELYIQQFPSGIYAALAKRKIGKLRGVATDDHATKSGASQDQEKREIEEAARREAEAKQQLAAEKAEMEALLAKREAEFLKREEELKKREAEVPKKQHPLLVTVAAILVAAAAIALWQVFKPEDPRVVELTKLLAEAKQRDVELQQMKQRESDAAKELIALRQQLQSADAAKQAEINERIRQREDEVRKGNELRVQREAEAEKRRQEIARLQGESKKAPRTPEPVRTPEPPKPVAETPKAPEPPKPVAETPKAGEATKLAMVTPTPGTTPTSVPDTSVESMLQRAIVLEDEGKFADATRLLRQATRGSLKGPAVGQAAKRLADIYNKGAPGVPRDYADALKYYEIARANGVDVPKQGPR
jgi:serine/threonine protein kinase